MKLSCLWWLKAAVWVVPCFLWSHPCSAVPIVYTYDGTAVQALDLAAPSNTTTIYLPQGIISEGGPPTAFTLSPDGSKAFIGNLSVSISEGGSSQAAILLDLSSGEIKKAFPLSGIVTSAAFSPDSRKVYVCLEDGTVVVVNVKDPTQPIRPSISLRSIPTAIAVTPDGSRAYVCSYDFSSVAVLDLHSNTLLTTLTSLDFSFINPQDLCISPDGSKVYVSNNYDNGPVTIVDTATNTEDPLSPIAVAGNPEGIAITPDGSKVYTVGSGIVTVIDTANPTSPSLISLPFAASVVAFTPDGSKACVAGFGELAIINVQTGAIDSIIPCQLYVGAINIAGIIAPSKFQGTLKHKEHKTILKTCWKESPAKHVKKYEIFNFNTKVATISADKPLCKKIVPAQPVGGIQPPYILGLETNYRIRAVDSSGNVSSFIQLHIKE